MIKPQTSDIETSHVQYLFIAERLARHRVVAALEGAAPHRRRLRLRAATLRLDAGVVDGTSVEEHHTAVYIDQSKPMYAL